MTLKDFFDTPKKLESVLEELHQLNDTTSQARIESILLEELRQMGKNASQASSETSNTFYVYLVAVNIVVPGIAGLAAAYLQFRGQKGFQYTDFVLEGLTAAGLLVLGIASFLFQQRFGELSNNRYDAIVNMNCVKKYFREKGINPDLLPDEKNNTRSYGGIPAYIRQITNLLGSFCFAGSAFILIGFLVYRVIVPLSLLSDLWGYLITVLLAVLVFCISFFVSERIYK